MANDNKLYDTVKDKKGNRYRVTDMRGEDGHIIASLKGINGDGTTKRGMPRRVAVDELEKKYTRVNLPEVTVRKIDDLSEGKHANAKEAKPAQIEEQTVRALSEEEVEEELTASTFGGSKMEDHEQMRDSLEKTNAQLRVRDHDLEVLKEERDALRVECLDYAEDRERLRGELAEAKKTISKMQQAHEAEVQDLKDKLYEARADAAVAEKNHALAVGEKNDYADALDNDSIAFEEILQLAVLMERSAKSMQEVSKMIQEKTEGRI